MSRVPKDAANLGAARNECGKIAYDARWKAKRVEKENRKVGRDHMAPYLCDQCGLWHLGHSRRLARNTPLAPRSKKTAKVYHTQRRDLVAEILTAEPFCQIRWDGNCAGVADTVHELKKRSRGGSITDRSNCVSACAYCNGAVEDNPVEAHARGFALHSWEDSA